jgi:hypothetical protein
MISQEFVKSIASAVTKELFEGGPGSGNWSHKGRPGHRGGSLVGGGKGKGAGGGGISAHVVKPGVHASTFYDKSGGLKTSDYRKLTDTQKIAVLRHGVQKYKEAYVPKAKQVGMSASALGANKKVGALEGMRRAALSKAKSEKSGSKEERAAMHIAISLQQRVRQMAGQLKASGQKVAGSVTGTGARVTGAALTAVKTAERQPGARG